MVWDWDDQKTDKDHSAPTQPEEEVAVGIQIGKHRNTLQGTNIVYHRTRRRILIFLQSIMTRTIL